MLSCVDTGLLSLSLGLILITLACPRDLCTLMYGSYTSINLIRQQNILTSFFRVLLVRFNRFSRDFFHVCTMRVALSSCTRCCCLRLWYSCVNPVPSVYTSVHSCTLNLNLIWFPTTPPRFLRCGRNGRSSPVLYRSSIILASASVNNRPCCTYHTQVFRTCCLLNTCTFHYNYAVLFAASFAASLIFHNKLRTCALVHGVVSTAGYSLRLLYGSPQPH